MDRLDYITKDRKGKHLIYLSFRKLKKEIKKKRTNPFVYGIIELSKSKKT